MVATFVLEAFAAWRKGQRGWMVFNLVMAAFAAFSAWERYAFGLLFGRDEAELRDVQTKC